MNVTQFLDARESWETQIPGYSYKLAPSQYALDSFASDKFYVDEAKMAVYIPFASGERRDGVGDLLEIGGIETDRHRVNPIVLFDHGKQIALPIAVAEDPETKNYTVELDTMSKIGGALCYFYGAKSLNQDQGAKTPAYEHLLFCEQIFDMMAKRFIRGGSIGYTVIHANELPPDFRTGTPAGLHLLRVKMLEVSAVILPANQDTVSKGLDKWVSARKDMARRILSIPKICGKAPSPYLVKSLLPIAGQKKVTLYAGQSQKNYVGGIGSNKFPVYEDPKTGRPQRLNTESNRAMGANVAEPWHGRPQGLASRNDDNSDQELREWGERTRQQKANYSLQTDQQPYMSGGRLRNVAIYENWQEPEGMSYEDPEDTPEHRAELEQEAREWDEEFGQNPTNQKANFSRPAGYVQRYDENEVLESEGEETWPVYEHPEDTYITRAGHRTGVPVYKDPKDPDDRPADITPEDEAAINAIASDAELEDKAMRRPQIGERVTYAGPGARPSEPMGEVLHTDSTGRTTVHWEDGTLPQQYDLEHLKSPAGESYSAEEKAVHPETGIDPDEPNSYRTPAHDALVKHPNIGTVRVRETYRDPYTGAANTTIVHHRQIVPTAELTDIEGEPYKSIQPTRKALKPPRLPSRNVETKSANSNEHRVGVTSKKPGEPLQDYPGAGYYDKVDRHMPTETDHPSGYITRSGQAGTAWNQYEVTHNAPGQEPKREGFDSLEEAQKRRAALANELREQGHEVYEEPDWVQEKSVDDTPKPVKLDTSHSVDPGIDPEEANRLNAVRGRPKPGTRVRANYAGQGEPIEGTVTHLDDSHYTYPVEVSHQGDEGEIVRYYEPYEVTDMEGRPYKSIEGEDTKSVAPELRKPHYKNPLSNSNVPPARFKPGAGAIKGLEMDEKRIGEPNPQRPQPGRSATESVSIRKPTGRSRLQPYPENDDWRRDHDFGPGVNLISEDEFYDKPDDTKSIPLPTTPGEAEMNDNPEPYGAQVLRRLHEDGSRLLADYDSLLYHLEHEPTRQHLMQTCAAIEDGLSVVEKMWRKEKRYKELPPLIKSEEELDQEIPEEELMGEVPEDDLPPEQMQDGLPEEQLGDEEWDQPMAEEELASPEDEYYGEEMPGMGMDPGMEPGMEDMNGDGMPDINSEDIQGDMDTIDDNAVPANSGAELPPPTPEEAWEASQRPQDDAWSQQEREFVARGSGKAIKATQRPANMRVLERSQSGTNKQARQEAERALRQEGRSEEEIARLLNEVDQGLHDEPPPVSFKARRQKSLRVKYKAIGMLLKGMCPACGAAGCKCYMKGLLPAEQKSDYAVRKTVVRPTASGKPRRGSVKVRAVDPREEVNPGHQEELDRERQEWQQEFGRNPTNMPQRKSDPTQPGNRINEMGEIERAGNIPQVKPPTDQQKKPEQKVGQQNPTKAMNADQIQQQLDMFDWDDQDRSTLMEISSFVDELGQEGSIFDEETRMKAYHYHKTMEKLMASKSNRNVNESLPYRSDDPQYDRLPPENQRLADKSRDRFHKETERMMYDIFGEGVDYHQPEEDDKAFEMEDEGYKNMRRNNGS